MTDIIIGDCRTEIPNLEDLSIDCIMTSPPYWGLRDYGHSEQLGLESTPEEYLDNMLHVFDLVKPKLKDVGNCFVNLGDTYSGSGKDVGGTNQKESFTFEEMPLIDANIPDKCLCMIPQRFAWGMIEHGWILRNEIIWHKPNHMPESVTDRLTKSHEVVYHFVKQGKYYYDLDAIREPLKTDLTKLKTMPKFGGNKYPNTKGMEVYSGNEWNPLNNVKDESTYQGKFKDDLNHESFGSPRARTQRKPYAVAERTNGEVEYRDNLPSLEDLKFYLSTVRNGLTIDEIENVFGNQAPHHWFSGECYPSSNDWLKLKEILQFDNTYDFVMSDVKIKPSDKVNNQIGKNPDDVWQINTQPYKEAHFAVFPLKLVEKPILAGCPVGGRVLDMFGGSSTVAEFCRHNERECTIIELNEEYKPLIDNRSMANTPLLSNY